MFLNLILSEEVISLCGFDVKMSERKNIWRSIDQGCGKMGE